MKQTFKQFAETIDEIEKLKQVPEETLLEPIREGKWSVRDIIGHMQGWDSLILGMFVPEMAKGANLPPFPNHDVFNAASIESIEGLSAREVIDRFIHTRKQLVGAVSVIDQDVRFTIGDGKRQFSAESLIKVFLKHDTHHLEQISEKLRD